MPTMRARVGSLVVLAAILSVGCSRNLELNLPVGEPVRVLELGGTAERVLLPHSDAYLQLVSWLETNRSGWSQYYATPPPKGVVVRAADLNLQFVESAVLAHTREGVFTKSILPADYAFLR